MTTIKLEDGWLAREFDYVTLETSRDDLIRKKRELARLKFQYKDLAKGIKNTKQQIRDLTEKVKDYEKIVAKHDEFYFKKWQEKDNANL